MPGSSTVLSNLLGYQVTDLTPNYLEGLLVWLLKSDIEADRYHQETCSLRKEIDDFADAFSSFLRRQASIDRFLAASERLRLATYDLGDDREFLFVDIIIAVALRKIDYSAITCLPQYSGLALPLWQSTLDKPNFIKEFWPAQRLLGQKGVLNGASAIVQMPTSAGKTKSTELIIRSAFLSGRASVAVIVAPFRALCREISMSFGKAFDGEDVTLNELRDIPLLSDEENTFIKRLLGQDLLQQPAGNTVIVSTPEKMVYLLRHEPDLASKIGLLVLDEGHQFDTGRRGVTYELLLASLKKQVPEECQKVLISAVMSNAESIGDWLNGDAGVAISGDKLLPTIRSVAFTSWKTKRGQLDYFIRNEYDEPNFFVPRLLEEIKLAKRPKERKDRIFPDRDSVQSIAAYLGVKLAPQGPVAIFCGDKRSIVSIGKSLVDYYDRGLPFPRPVETCDQEEITKLTYLAELHWGPDYTLSKSMALGILPHSANVPNGLRVAIEWAMENNKARLVVCTSTLAQGVNLPIKYLVVSSTLQAGQEISTRDFHNLIGRAGRAGYHTEGSIIFADPRIFDKKHVRGQKWRWERVLHLLDFANAEDCLSSLLELIRPFSDGMEELDPLDFIREPNAIRNQVISWGEEHEVDVSNWLFELAKRSLSIQAIESYFLSYLKDNPTADEQVFTSLCEDTLAHSLADDMERAMLLQAFAVISERVQAIDEIKYPYFGRAILGIEQLMAIESWATENLEAIRDSNESTEDLLRLSWPLLEIVGGSTLIMKIQPAQMRVELAERWISGASYAELHDCAMANEVYVAAKTRRHNITMEHIVEFTDNGLGYEAMLVIGALADILEGLNEAIEVVDAVRLLQARMRYGLCSKLDLWLYQEGYVDREVCKRLSAFLSDHGIDVERFEHDVLDTNKDEIERVMAEFPTYFNFHLEE